MGLVVRERGMQRVSAVVALSSLLCGILAARWLPLPPRYLAMADELSFVALCWMVFAVGIIVGAHKETWAKVFQKGWRLALLPLGTLLVSALAAAFVGTLLGLSLPAAAAIGSACGWYSLSGVAVAKTWGAEAGLLAFAVNFLRELIAFGLVPLVAKRSQWAAIALCGATAADTTLPLIARAAGPEGALTALLSGGLITALVPLGISLLATF